MWKDYCDDFIALILNPFTIKYVAKDISYIKIGIAITIPPTDNCCITPNISKCAAMNIMIAPTIPIIDNARGINLLLKNT